MAEQPKVAILATDGVEQVELTSPRDALKQAGATVHVVSPRDGTLQGFNHTDKGDAIPVDVKLSEADPSAYDMLIVPGGLYNPDELRSSDEAKGFVKAFFEADKPVGSICHGPQVLISAGLAKGRRMTGFSSIQVDLANAGAEVVDEEAVVDGKLITSRNPDDLEAFNAELKKALKL